MPKSKKIDYGEIENVCYRGGLRVRLSLKCHYKNESLGVVGEVNKWNDDGTPMYTKRYRLVILGNGHYSGLALDFLYPKSKKKAIELADKLNDVGWNIFSGLSQDDKNKLVAKLREAAGIS